MQAWGLNKFHCQLLPWLKTKEGLNQGQELIQLNASVTHVVAPIFHKPFLIFTPFAFVEVCL